MITYSSRIITNQIKIMTWGSLSLTCLLLLIISLSLVFTDTIPIHRNLGTEYMVKVIVALIAILFTNIGLCKFTKKLTFVSSEGGNILLDRLVVDASKVTVSEISVLGYTFGRVTIHGDSLFFVPQKDFIKYRAYFTTSTPKNVSIKNLFDLTNT